MEQTRQRVVLGPWRVPDHEQARSHRPRRRRRGRGSLRWHPSSSRSPSSNVGGPASQPPVRPSATPSPTPSTAPSASPAASPPPLTADLHLAAAWDLRVLPRGMDRSKRRPSPGRTAPTSPTPLIRLPTFCTDPVLTDHLFLVIRFAADRQFHARRVGRRADGERRVLGYRADRRGRRHRTDRRPTTATHGRRHNRRPRLLDPASVRLTTTPPPSRPTIGRGSRRSLRPSSSSPRMPSTWRRPRRRSWSSVHDLECPIACFGPRSRSTSRAAPSRLPALVAIRGRLSAT